MSTKVAQHNMDDTRLWVAALLCSVFVNAVILALLGHAVIQKNLLAKDLPTQPEPPEQVVKIYPDMIQAEKPEVDREPEKPEVVRTSSDQETAEAPKQSRYIGERNTRATSDAPPTDDEIEMPSQKGRERRPDEAVETTESQYQDGELPELNQSAEPQNPVQPPVENPTRETLPNQAQQAKGTETPDQGDAEVTREAIRETLLQGANPVEIPTPKADLKEDAEPQEATKARDGEPDATDEEKIAKQEQPKPTSEVRKQETADPAFRGNQSKTAILGNISRTGRSALDVVDTPMGRYQAKLSRAIEQEFQRNCVRRRDFIVPGYLTTRFFVDAEGRVKTVELIGEIEGGKIQKGFTLDSIRNADIPAMPPAVKKEMDGEPLELIFNFYF